MMKTVIPRLVTSAAVCHLPCRHLTSLSSLQSSGRMSDGGPTSAVRRGMSENAAVAKTPSFHHFWKPGSGYYADSLGRLTKGAADICEEFVLSHMDFIPVPSPKGVFTIGDYGTCDGSVSLQLIHRIIDHLRNKHGPDLKIQVLYEDQPSNDYNSLFKTIYGKSSYMAQLDNVFSLVCGTSFYKQCVPDNSCDIILSSFATQWLSERSHVRSCNTIFPWKSTSEKELRAYQEVSSRDWKKFLLLRAAELKQGGLLFIAQPSAKLSSSPSECGTLEEGSRDICDNLDLSWNELYAKGVITREEFQSCSVPLAMRTLPELKAPFENDDMSSVRQSGLNLLREPEEIVLPCHAKTMWRKKLQSDGIDDRNMFAQLLAQAFRVIIESTLRNSLKNMRTPEEQQIILEQLFDTFVRKVSSLNPETFRSETSAGRLIAQKLQ